jgi:hypothetical protein
MSSSVIPVVIYGLADFDGDGIFVRTYQISFANFAEALGGATIVEAGLVGGAGITATAGTPGTQTVPLTISGGSENNTYSGSVQVVLSNGAKVEQPYSYTVVAPGGAGQLLSFQSWAKTVYYDRFYQFPFGQCFPGFSVAGNPIVGPLMIEFDDETDLTIGTPTVDGTTTRGSDSGVDQPPSDARSGTS